MRGSEYEKQKDLFKLYNEIDKEVDYFLKNLNTRKIKM